MKPKIIFIGGTPRGLAVMEMLIEQGQDVVQAFILKEDDHEAGKVSRQLAEISRKANIPFKICKKIEAAEAPQVLAKNPDVAFVSGWRTMIPKELYQKIPLGCLAAHDSLLPKYRGCAPTVWAIINGEKETGVTLFKISDQGVDAGDVFGQKSVPIGENDTATEIYPFIVQATVDLYQKFLEACQDDVVEFVMQDESRATYAKKRAPADGEIDWSRPAREVFNFIRALMPPYPRSWTLLDNDKIFIARASLSSEKQNTDGVQIGRLVSIARDSVGVRCGDGIVLLHQIIDAQGNTRAAHEVLDDQNMVLGRDK